ncbi:hypothetical protein [Undibacterium griseum]|uniref:DDE family transposase n=1 Tax=Undibacterium griseum TaxID=2762295 RepID=A0ABR6YKT7_9BURK|nr:hypothetical protein [Undibacterium griseum]MBC3884517.1 hypothetical protein [Undibacterium griseum]
MQGFLANTLHHLGTQKVALLRADSGFPDRAFLENLEWQNLNYIIALLQTHPLQRALVDARGWWTLLDEQGDIVLKALNSAVSAIRPRPGQSHTR